MCKQCRELNAKVEEKGGAYFDAVISRGDIAKALEEWEKAKRELFTFKCKIKGKGM